MGMLFYRYEERFRTQVITSRLRRIHEGEKLLKDCKASTCYLIISEDGGW
jgi:hypothetical protein